MGDPPSLVAEGRGAALSASEGLGTVLGLVVGAPLGGFFLACAFARLTTAHLSEGLDWPAIGGVAPLKGIGFTVAIFISELAFTDQLLRDQAKLAILLASGIAAVLGMVILYLRSRSSREPRWFGDEAGASRGTAASG